MNQVTLTGNLTKDPEMRYTPSGLAVCTFGLANNEGFGDNQKTLFIDCVVFGKKDGPGQAGAIADNLGKGSKVLVTGELQKRSWEGQDGNKRWAVEILVRRCEFLDSKATREARSGNHTEQRDDERGDAGQQPVGAATDVDPDEIPF